MNAERPIDYSGLGGDFLAETAHLEEAWSPDVRALAASLAESFEFQRRLFDLRKAFGLSQARVAEITGEQQSEISRMETGAVNPSVRRANRILERLGAYAGRHAAESPAAVALSVANAARRARRVSAGSVAAYFLAIQDDEDAITNLKLQKLLYYAQGFCLAMLGRPLFSERIKAWEHGPVVPAVWHSYNKHGNEPIPRPDDIDLSTIDEESRRVMDKVYAIYGQYSPWRLREMTHAEEPWKSTARNEAISHQAMTGFFTAQLAVE